MSTKVNFRARTLDASKPMAVYRAEDLPDLQDLNSINRAVPALPTGMEKEEETEKHLQDILEAQIKGLVGEVTVIVIHLLIHDSTIHIDPFFILCLTDLGSRISTKPVERDNIFKSWGSPTSEPKIYIQLSERMLGLRKFKAFLKFNPILERGSTVRLLLPLLLLLRHAQATPPEF